MKPLQIRVPQGQVLGVFSHISEVAFAYGNEYCNEDFHSSQRAGCNLEIICENEDPTYQYHYYFDCRFAQCGERRIEGETRAEMLAFNGSELDHIASVLDSFKDSNAISDADYDEMDMLVEKLRKYADKFNDWSQKYPNR